MDEKTELVGQYYFMMAVALVVVLVLSGCRTTYYPPRDGEKQGAIRSEGWDFFSEGGNKSFLNPSLSVIGK